jgi:hypothetical protein
LFALGALLFTAIAPHSARAQSPLCLATGQVVNGDTTGLDVQPCPQPTTINALNAPDTPLQVLPDPPPGNFSTLYWGYGAAFASAPLNAYRAVAGNPLVASCVPSGPHIPVTSNGRGVAFDPLDGNLWISRLTFFAGDARITKVIPPNVSPGTCPEVTSLLVHHSDGSAPEQTGFGALDVDDSKHIWAAGYFPPVIVNGMQRDFFYLVDRNNGLIIHSCFLHKVNGFFDGNDSLTFARIPGLPGSGRYLITDDGEFLVTDPLLVIDVADCHDGREVTPVATFPNPGLAAGPHAGTGVTGIDFEWLGLLNTNLFNSYINSGTPPFAASTLLGPTGALIEDIALCGFRAKLGGDGNDFCPYP